MKNIILGLIVTLFLIGCAESKPLNVESKILIGNSIESLQLNNQFDKPQKITADITRIIFAFSKDMGHLSKEYFSSKEADFLPTHHTTYVVNISAAPSLVQTLFIMPGLKDLTYSVSIIDDETVAAQYSKEAHTEELMVVTVDNFMIKDISYVSTRADLAKLFQ